MKRFIFILCVILLPAVMMGHSPKKIDASYNEKTKKVKIVVAHSVKDVNKHFIESISIYQGEKEIKVIPLTEQTEKAKEVLEVELPGISKGSEITITAKCSVMGSKKQTMKL